MEQAHRGRGVRGAGRRRRAGESAQVATDTLEIRSAYSRTNQEVQGKLWVWISGTSPVTSIRADVIHPTTGQVVATTTDFAQADGTWVTRERFMLNEIGHYHVNIEATDAAGNKVRKHVQGPGTGSPLSTEGLLYQVVPFITDVKATPDTIDG